MDVRELVETVYREGEEEGRRTSDPYVTLQRLDAVYISMTDQERAEFDAILGEWARGEDPGKRHDAIALIDNFKITSALDDVRALREELAGATDGPGRDWLESVDETIAYLEADAERPDLLLMGMGEGERLSSAALAWLARLLKKDASFITRTDHPEEVLGAWGRGLLDAGVVQIDRRKGVKLEPPLSAIYSQVFEGYAMISVEHDRGDKTYLRTYHLGGDEEDLAVEHIPLPSEQHDFYLVDVENLFKRMAVFTGLAEDRPVSSDPPFIVPLPDLVAAVQGSADAPVPEHFRRHLETKISSTRVRAVLRTETGIAGGEVMWVDLGRAGLWAIDPSDENMAAVAPISAEDLLSRIEKVMSA